MPNLNPSPVLLEEWQTYVRYHDVLSSPFLILEFWEGVCDHFPNLATIASLVIWMPVTSKRSFPQYKHILNDR